MQKIRKPESNLTSGGVWVTKPFQTGKKAIQKMKAHAITERHVRHFEAELTANGGSIVHQLQHTGELKRAKNRNAIKSFNVLISYANSIFSHN